MLEVAPHGELGFRGMGVGMSGGINWAWTEAAFLNGQRRHQLGKDRGGQRLYLSDVDGGGIDWARVEVSIGMQVGEVACYKPVG